jgi:hypothetical protein
MTTLAAPLYAPVDGLCRPVILGVTVRPPPGLEDVVPDRSADVQPAVCRDDSESLCSTAADSHEVESFAACRPEAPEQKPALQLADTVACGCSALPSVGSAGHHLGLCKPCDFLHRSAEGCKAGQSCKFCHLCGAEENKRRKLAKRQMLRSVRLWQKSVPAPPPPPPGL